MSGLKPFDGEIWIRYVAAFAASLQSKRIGCATVALSAGATRLGVPGAGGGAGFGTTVSPTDRLAGARRAVMVTGVLAATVAVVTVKPADVWPAGTVTTGCGFAAGAGELRTTVPATAVPPTTVGVASVTAERSGGAFGSGATSMNADFVTPP